jgi:hypothetical protein
VKTKYFKVVYKSPTHNGNNDPRTEELKFEFDTCPFSKVVSFK